MLLNMFVFFVTNKGKRFLQKGIERSNISCLLHSSHSDILSTWHIEFRSTVTLTTRIFNTESKNTSLKSLEHWMNLCPTCKRVKSLTYKHIFLDIMKTRLHLRNSYLFIVGTDCAAPCHNEIFPKRSFVDVSYDIAVSRINMKSKRKMCNNVWILTCDSKKQFVSI